MPPYRYLIEDKPVKGGNHFIEHTWTWKECTLGINPRIPAPHVHDFDEVFFWIGTNPKDPDDLGGEVEFCMGKGDEMEKIPINTTALIYIPKGIAHTPIIYKKVDRPILCLTITLNTHDWVLKPLK